jgi:hypothetical protein
MTHTTVKMSISNEKNTAYNKKQLKTVPPPLASTTMRRASFWSTSSLELVFVKFKKIKN